MADIAIFRINYKSDFILTLKSDAGWMTPFCIKFWTGAPSQAYFAGYDGTTYTHCAPVEGEATKLRVQFDDHHLPIGDLKFQIAYHFTVADFSTSVEDEVLNQASVIVEVDDAPAQVMLDLNGETGPEIEFSLPAYANEAQRIANEEERIENEQQRISNEETRIANEETRQRNEATRIAQEETRVSEFARLKRESQQATTDANDAATLANQKAQLAQDKADLAQAAATLADQKAQLAADKAALANDAAQLANEKAALAQQKAEYAQQQGGYAKDQGDYAKDQGDYAKAQGTIAEEDHQRAEADHGIAADDHTQADNDHTRAESDHDIAADDHTQAGNDHTRAEADHDIAVDDHTQAGNDHTRAEADHGIAADDHTRAESDHTRAESDHTRAESDHAAVEVYVDSLGVFDLSKHNAVGDVLATYANLDAALTALNALDSKYKYGGMSFKFVQSSDNKYVQYRLIADEFSTDMEDWEHAASAEYLESGNLVPALAGNLKSWEGVEGESDYVQTSVANTTGGTLSIDSSEPANLLSVVPTSDFGATALVATGFNLLRFATAVGTGWYILVPKLTATAASIGTAQENNGVLFTDAQGNNLRPTVRFKALADGVPESVTDGVAATYVDADGRRHYTTSGIGYLIVSDINRATTCMHLGWSRRYDEYVAVDAAGDAGATVNLAAGINALHDFGLMLQIGALADSIERTSASQVTWYRRIDRVQPTWTNTPVEEEGVATGQYLHEALISNMRPDGAAAFMASDQALSVTGTTVSYTDGNAEALTNYVKFELAAVVSGTASVSSSFAVEDWGLVLIQGATGTAAFTIAYAQGIPDNLRTALPQLNAIRTTAAAISLGHGICSTDTYTKDKVVSIPNFLLLLNGHINVLFTTPINTENSTLNVSLTGAKPIRILGQNLPAGVIKAETYATLAYDGTAWNIVNLFCPGAEYDPAGLLVDMGLPSGVKWAARDIDLTKPGGFCDTPFTYMKSFFSWGNIDGHNPISNSAFDYNWGGVNGADPWYEGQPYGSTPGNTLTGSIAVGEDFDAARANLGEPWRMPTNAEFAELFANIIYIDANGDEVDTTKTDKRVNVNGVLGFYLESTINSARLFFSCSGYGVGRSWGGRGSGGYYWSSTWYSARVARNLNFNSGGVYPQDGNNRYNGFALRPVQ